MLKIATQAARQAGDLLRKNLGTNLKVNEASIHDIKLEMDIRAQKTIERVILKHFPQHAILGEERISGNPDADYRWIIDPLDGTVNYAYGVPHFCVSIACQRKSGSFQCSVSGVQHNRAKQTTKKNKLKTENLKPETFSSPHDWQTVCGVIYDPIRDEMFTASAADRARLNGKPIRASARRDLSQAIVSVGFFKTSELINRSLPHFTHLVHHARKVRIMGAAALDLAYVASGRYDVYLEYGVKLWDIAAGLFILEKAGGIAEVKSAEAPYAYNVFASGNVNRKSVVANFKFCCFCIGFFLIAC